MSDAPLLELEDVHAFYGSAHILEGVSLSMGLEAIAVIGRNGMGKSTLCNTIMGLCRESRGSIRVNGDEMRGRMPYVVAGAGVGYVPQGRRLFQSLSVDEHLRMIRSPRERPEAGSSSIISCGSVALAMPTSSWRCWPCESEPTGAFSESASHTRSAAARARSRCSRSRAGERRGRNRPPSRPTMAR